LKKQLLSKYHTTKWDFKRDMCLTYAYMNEIYLGVNKKTEKLIKPRKSENKITEKTKPWKKTDWTDYNF